MKNFPSSALQSPRSTTSVKAIRALLQLANCFPTYARHVRRSLGGTGFRCPSSTSSGHGSSSNNPARPGQGALCAPCSDPAGDPLFPHRVQTCKLAVPAPSAIAPQLFREAPSHLYAGGSDPRLDCFPFPPFCQCVRPNSVLAQ